MSDQQPRESETLGHCRCTVCYWRGTVETTVEAGLCPKCGERTDLMRESERTARTPEQVLAYCAVFPEDWSPLDSRIVKFVALALIDLPAMARRVIELEKALANVEVGRQGNYDLFIQRQDERDKLAAQVEELQDEVSHLLVGHLEANIPDVVIASLRNENDALRKALADVMQCVPLDVMRAFGEPYNMRFSADAFAALERAAKLLDTEPEEGRL